MSTASEAGRWVRWRNWANSLQARMVMVLGAFFLVPVAYSAFQAANAVWHRTVLLEETLQQTVNLAASYHDEFLNQVHGLLRDLSAQPEIVALRQPECSQLLRRRLARAPDYLDLVATDAAGIVRCSASARLLDHDLDDRPYQSALRAGITFAAEVRAAEGDNESFISFAMPLAPSAPFDGSVAARVERSIIASLTSRLDLPEDSVLYLVDRDGHVLSSTGAHAGVPAQAANLARPATAAPAQLLLTGNDGVERRFVRTELAHGNLMLLLGLPQDGYWAWLERDLVLGVFMPALMLALAVLGIWIATDTLVNRHIRALAETARAYSGGDLNARPPLAGAPTELREMGLTLARMADRISEREDDLRASLAQKETMLREIHHRVKNNLQIVTSLLNLRARGVRSQAARHVMTEAQTRIKALALVHRNLYEHDDLQAIELRAFIAELCELLQDFTESGSTVRLRVDVGPVSVPTDKAIPLSLLITECVSNAFKHAFPDGSDGVVEVRLEMAQRRVRLTIADDGVGLRPDEAGNGDQPGIGMTLVHLLAKQISADLSIAGPPGTRVTVAFDA